MSIPTITVFDLKKGVEITREMNNDELEQLAKDQTEAENQAAQQAAHSAAKQAARDKLKALGLTDLEIAAITGA